MRLQPLSKNIFVLDSVDIKVFSLSEKNNSEYKKNIFDFDSVDIKMSSLKKI